MEFAYDGGGLAKGGLVSLFIDGETVGEGQIGATVPMIYSADETCDVGLDAGTPVSEDYTISTVTSTARSSGCSSTRVDNHDHLITAEERFRVAAAIQ